jgi:hypothetical protein
LNFLDHAIKVVAVGSVHFELMANFMPRTRHFFASPTYAVMLALIIVVCLTAIQAVGTNVKAMLCLVGTPERGPRRNSTSAGFSDLFPLAFAS